MAYICSKGTYSQFIIGVTDRMTDWDRHEKLPSERCCIDKLSIVMHIAVVKTIILNQETLNRVTFINTKK